ncbi:RING finger protein 112 [Pogona vitticeps]
MGNKNIKLPDPPADPPKQSAKGMIQTLQEDIICSICLESFDDPVSIDCGHNFCRGCLTAHWSVPLQNGYRCPECRHPCSRERMKPDTRLKNLVEKIGQLPLPEEFEKEKEIPILLSQMGEPVQLVGLDENGNLCLDEAVLSSCLEEGQVKDSPVCLISILGEQRRGKSFLLNFLRRRFQNLVAEDDSWMGEENDPLAGFEWRPGPTTTTKGIWIWSQPFWISTEHGKVAMFLVDTEGSMDVDRSKETSVKLSAFSMLLSSYQIFNVATTMKDADLEYLEMFVYVAETVGRACHLRSIQHLDILVRDWFYPPIYGLQGGQKYLQDVRERLENQPNKHPRVLGTLKKTTTRCYLMPFPGKKVVVETEGTLADMDDDFRECLRDYGNDLARSAAMHVKRNWEGAALTGAQLASKIKNFSGLMRQYQFGFSSVTQLAITIHNLDTRDTLQREFADFIKEQELLSRPMVAGLRVTPSSMTKRVLEKQRELVRQCEMALQGDELDRTNVTSLLESHLQADTKDFLERYSHRYKSHALKAGIAIGVGAVGLAGGAVGAGVAAAMLAAEAIVLSTGTAATFAIGTMAGAGTFALVGGGVGAGLGSSIGERRAREAENVAEPDCENEEAEDDLSDERCLLRQ